MYGPVRTVVWEDRGREAPSYPICGRSGVMCCGWSPDQPVGDLGSVEDLRPVVDLRGADACSPLWAVAWGVRGRETTHNRRSETTHNNTLFCDQSDVRTGLATAIYYVKEGVDLRLLRRQTRTIRQLQGHLQRVKLGDLPYLTG